MSYNCGDCGNGEYACMGWDGKGASNGAEYNATVTNHSVSMGETFPNHNLVASCPPKFTDCQYRLKKTPSAQIK